MGGASLRCRAAAALVGGLLAVAGCTGEEPAEPELPAGYAPPPKDLCERASLEEVLQRWELSPPPGREPPESRYSSPPDSDNPLRWWGKRCWTLGVAQDSPFATRIRDFEVNGFVKVEVYHRTERAIRMYDNQVAIYQRPDGAVWEETAGWWDAGVAVTYAKAWEPTQERHQDVVATTLQGSMAVRHENLVVLATLESFVWSRRADDAADMMKEIVAAMIEAAAEHVPYDG